MKLTRIERWILSNQFAILAKLYPEEADSYANMREVVDNGYELNYDWIAQYIYDDTITETECKEVLDILSMFLCLKRGYEALTDKSGIEDRWVRFRGFDGNHSKEAKYLSYTRFLVEREDKFTSLDRGDNFNSHAPLLSRYCQMVEEWKKSEKIDELSKQDIIRITSIWR